MTQSILKEIKNDYKITQEAYLEAKKSNNKELMKRLSNDLISLADRMEVFS